MHSSGQTQEQKTKPRFLPQEPEQRASRSGDAQSSLPQTWALGSVSVRETRLEARQQDVQGSPGEPQSVACKQS